MTQAPQDRTGPDDPELTEQAAQDGAPSTREGAPPAGEGEGRDDEQLDADLADAEAKAREDVANLTADLQRLQAEYLNYKRRVERDRQLVAENAAYRALTPVVEVLDTIDRARESGEVEGGFRAVAEQLERAVASSGLVRFGQPGDPFDPNLHEALSHLGEDPEVDVTTVKVVAKAGYRLGERIVRAAQVLVVDPGSPPVEAAPDTTGERSDGEPTDGDPAVGEPPPSQG